jgi:ribonuclease P protein component
MKKCDVVKNNREFDNIIAKGKYVKNNDFVIYYTINELNKDRFGISVGKKIGNAVTRNYYKRVIRNICDMNKSLYSNDKDYIIIMRKGLINLSFLEMNDSYKNLIEKINKKEKEQNNEKTN